MTGKEYLTQQVHPLGFNGKVSTLTFLEEEIVRCPNCGKQLESKIGEDGKFDLKHCDCSFGKEELQVVSEIEEIKEKIKSLENDLSNKKKEWMSIVYATGVKTAANHYMSMKPERDAFDSEIEELTK